MSEIYKALSAFQAEMPPVPCSKTINTGKFSYKYAPLDEIVRIAYPIMTKHGLSISHQTMWVNVDETQHLFMLSTKLFHVSGDVLECYMPLNPNVPPQQFGSDLTYKRRYSISALLGIVTDVDDDGTAAMQAKTQTRTLSQRVNDTKSKPGPVVPEVDPALLARQDQLDEIKALFKKLKVSSEAKKAQTFTYVAGREVTSVVDLTQFEAGKVVDYLTTVIEKQDEEKSHSDVAEGQGEFDV